MHKYRLFIWCSLSLILGVLIGFMSTQFVFFDVVYRIDVLYTSISLSTLLVGLYIAIVINKRATDKRVEKDLLINRLSEIKIKVYSIDEELNIERRLARLATLFKESSKSLSSFEKILNYCCKDILKDESIKVRNMFFKYKKLSTGGAAKDNIFQLVDSEKYSLDKIHENLILEIDLLILKINKI